MTETTIPRRTLLRAALGAALGASLPAARLGAGEPQRVVTSDELLTALRGARGGETLHLAPGEYAPLKLKRGRDGAFDFASPVTLTSEDRARPAVIRGLDLDGLDNLVFDGLLFDYRAGPGARLNAQPFRLHRGRNITILDSVFSGDDAQDGEPEGIGLPTGSGLLLGAVADARVENCLIEGFHRGLIVSSSRDVILRGNEVRGLRMDGLLCPQVQNLLIEGNFIHGFRRSSLVTDHSDMIQCWTNRTTEPTTGVTIRGNLLFAGPGRESQSIFMRNDQVDRGSAGKEMFYRDIRIEENVIINGHLHGITLGEAVDVEIRRNTLIRNQLFARGKARDATVLIPRINMAETSERVSVSENLAVAFPGRQRGWRVEGNLPIQDRFPVQAGYYGDVFANALEGDTQTLENYLYLQDLPAGASLLRPGADRSAFRARA